MHLHGVRDRLRRFPALPLILRDLSSAVGRRVEDFSPAAIEVLTRYAWPDNVRELRNAVEYAAIERALAATGGNQTRAAALLGIDRVTLHKVKKLRASRG